MTHLNDLTKAYLDQIVEKKKDDSYLETDMKKRQANNEKARKDMEKMGTSMKNPHFEEKKLDPVGQEDADVDNDGDVDSSDKYLKKRRKAIGKAMKKESFVKSDWRDSLSEVMTDIESKPIKEKKVNNKVKINPTMGEAVEEMGGTLLEEIEVDEFEGVVEEVYDELIEEGYSEDDVESAIEQALNEATVTVGHDTEGPKAERTRDKLKRKAKGFLGKVAVKAYNKAREAKVRATPAAQRAKTSAKRGIKKLAQKVVDRMSEEVMSEATYGGTKKPAPKDTRMTVTAADKAGNTPAYQKYKAGDKRYKAADHMKEGVRDVDPEKGTAERKARLEKKRGMKMDDHPQYQKEGYGAPGHNPGSGEKSVARAKALMDKQGRKGAPGLDAMAAAKKEHEARRGVKKEEVENVEEVYKGKHGQTDKQYADSRSPGGKMVSGDSKMSGAEYTHGRRVKAANPGMQPDVGGKTKPKSQGKMDRGTRADLEYRKANLKKEEIEVEEGYDEPKMHSAVKRVMTTQPAAKGRAASRLHSKYSMRSKGNVAGETDGPGPNAPKRSGRKGRGAETDRGSGNAAKRRMNTEEAAMSPGEVALQKKKAMIDKMIASKRMQGLKKSPEAPAKAMGEETEDSLRDKRQERGGVDGNTRYDRPAKNVATGPAKKKSSGMSALDFVKADIRSKYGKGAIIDTKKK